MNLASLRIKFSGPRHAYVAFAATIDAARVKVFTTGSGLEFGIVAPRLIITGHNAGQRTRTGPSAGDLPHDEVALIVISWDR